MAERKEKAERLQNASDKIMNIDLSKLDSQWGRGNPSVKNMIELMHNQLTFEQAKTMRANIKNGSLRRRWENGKEQLIHQTSMMPQWIPGQHVATPADTVTRVLTNPEWLVNFNAATPEAQHKMIAAIMQIGMISAGGINQSTQLLLPLLMMIQQQKSTPPKENISAKDLIISLTEGIKLGQNTQQTQNNPIDTFKAIKEIISPLQENNAKMQNELIKVQLQAIKEQSQQMSIEKTIEIIGKLNEVFGERHSANETDLAIAQLTAQTRFNERKLNLDERRIDEETKTEQLKWQTIEGMITSLAGAFTPSIVNSLTESIKTPNPQTPTPIQPQIL